MYQTSRSRYHDLCNTFQVFTSKGQVAGRALLVLSLQRSAGVPTDSHALGSRAGTLTARAANIRGVDPGLVPGRPRRAWQPSSEKNGLLRQSFVRYDCSWRRWCCEPGSFSEPRISYHCFCPEKFLLRRWYVSFGMPLIQPSFRECL